MTGALLPRAVGARERMDEPGVEPRLLARTLRELAAANRWFGGYGPVLREIRRVGATSVLDVGCGGGDVAAAIARDARRRGAAVALTLLDRSDEMLALARRALGDEARYVRADGERLPFDDDAFDVAVCTTALHHFEPLAARRLLRELRRVSRRTPVVVDLRRSLLGWLAVTLWTLTLARSPLNRHDGPLSMRRAYRVREAFALARDAGWIDPRVSRERFFRLALVDAARRPG